MEIEGFFKLKGIDPYNTQEDEDEGFLVFFKIILNSQECSIHKSIWLTITPNRQKHLTYKETAMKTTRDTHRMPKTLEMILQAHSPPTSNPFNKITNIIKSTYNT